MDAAYLDEHYFEWLSFRAFSHREDRRYWEGCLRALHDIPFYWTVWLDENRAGDALTRRQFDFVDDYIRDDPVVIQWMHKPASVLEVLCGIAHRWTEYFERPEQEFFQILFENLHLSNYPGRVIESRANDRIRKIVDIWLSHQFEPHGHGSPFPLDTHQLTMEGMGEVDLRGVDIWTQMNAYSAVHFQ